MEEEEDEDEGYIKAGIPPVWLDLVYSSFISLLI